MAETESEAGEAMKDTDRLLAAILRELKAIRIKLGAEYPKPVSSGASVSSVTRLPDGTVLDNGDSSDVPSQLEQTLVDAGPMKRPRLVTRRKE